MSTLPTGYSLTLGNGREGAACACSITPLPPSARRRTSRSANVCVYCMGVCVQCKGLQRCPSGCDGRRAHPHALPPAHSRTCPPTHRTHSPTYQYSTINPVPLHPYQPTQAHAGRTMNAHVGLLWLEADCPPA